MKYFRPLSFFVLSCLLVACAAVSVPRSENATPGIPLKACQLSSPGSSLRLEAQCGNYAVPEDPSAPAGRQIQLNIAMLKSIRRNPAPDALFFIPGGPGEAATESYLAVSTAFEHIRQKRDIVLIDQRGTGGSQALRCPQPGDWSSSEQSEQKEQEYLQDCLAGLEANPRLFTTETAVADLEQVRAALGYETINLYGGSYGTRVALAYARRYPEHVRTIILDGVAPPNWILGQSVAQDAQRALNLLFQRCAAEPECNKAFPSLPTKFRALLDKLRQSPMDLTLTDPLSGELRSFRLTVDFFASTIHTLTYTPETASLLPLLIHTAYERNDYNQIAALGLSINELVFESISAGMRYSVICAEDAPMLTSASQTAQASTEGYLGDYVLRSFLEVCAIWPRGEIPADFHQAVYSSVPVLLISGEVDPVTPPANGDLAAQTLPNSLHVVVPGHGHINIYRGCLPRIATDLIENGAVQNLDTACIQEMQPMPFFLTFSGPKP